MTSSNESFHLSRAQEELRAAERAQSSAAERPHRALAELHRELARKNRRKLTVGWPAGH